MRAKHLIIFLIFLLKFISNDSDLFAMSENRDINDNNSEVAVYLINNYQIMDPTSVVFNLDELLKTGDVENFKIITIYLFKEYGWNYSEIDTNNLYFTFVLLDEQIKKHNLSNWMIEASKIYYPIWVKNHQKELFIQSRIKALAYSDQKIRRYLPSDTNNPDYKTILKLVSNIDYSHILEIRTLCILNDSMMPNHYDNGIAIYNRIGHILDHNLGNKENFHQTWEALFYFIDKAYKAGKINNNAFKMYDIYSNYHYGYQYYGSLGDSIKVLDPEGLENRKTRYNLRE